MRRTCVLSRRTNSAGAWTPFGTVSDNVQNVGAVSWVLGDIFHSDPVLVDRPNNFFYYASNVHGLRGIDSDCINDTSYRCFSKKHRTRRKMLLVGANDGQLHAFDAGVNVTLGLPFPRTSPDHGTAFEIAGKGIARPDSMIAAINLAAELASKSRP